MTKHDWSDKIAKFAVSPQFLIDIMKHGIAPVRVVENALPEDAIFAGAFQADDMVWIVVASDTFSPLDPQADIPELPRTVFVKVS